MAEKKQLSVRLRPDQEAAVETMLAADPEATRASIIRKAIDEYIARSGVANARALTEMRKHSHLLRVAEVPQTTPTRVSRAGVSYSVKLARKKTRQAARRKKSAA
jgi:hypothetical protein